MKLDSLEQIFRTLNEAGVQYLVAGGLAVNAHGYLRFTKDVDFVLRLLSENIKQTFTALEGLGYKPTVPVTGEQFADPEQRQSWIENKGMQVLNFFSDQHRETTIDVFVYEPFDFQVEYLAAMQGDILPGLSVRFVSIPTLIQMKEAANRPRDIDDIQHLRWILEDQDSHE